MTFTGSAHSVTVCLCNSLGRQHSRAEYLLVVSLTVSTNSKLHVCIITGQATQQS